MTSAGAGPNLDAQGRVAPGSRVANPPVTKSAAVPVIMSAASTSAARQPGAAVSGSLVNVLVHCRW